MAKGKRYTYQDVKEIVEKSSYELVSLENEIVDKKGYVLTKTKIMVKCNNSNHDPYKVEFRHFKEGERCKKCFSDSLKLTYEYVKEYIESFGYDLISKEYINNSIDLDIKCDKGHKYKAPFARFQQGRRCPHCKGNTKYTFKYIKEYIESFEYKLLSNEYKNCNSHLLVQCPKSHRYKVTFNNFNAGYRCPYCYGRVKFTINEVKDYIESFGYELLSEEYINKEEKIKVKCDKNHEYEVTFGSFRNQGSRCPICNESKGERKITNWLDKNNIEYIYEKTFNDLFGLGNGNLSYDFYLPNYNLLIEYQGEQHEHQIEGFGDFKKQQEHDRRKREYAKKNGYKLLEIWYWDFDNIEKILNKDLGKGLSVKIQKDAREE